MLVIIKYGEEWHGMSLDREVEVQGVLVNAVDAVHVQLVVLPTRHSHGFAEAALFVLPKYGCGVRSSDKLLLATLHPRSTPGDDSFRVLFGCGQDLDEVVLVGFEPLIGRIF